MTNDEQYGEGRQETEYVFEERKAINKKFLSTCERKINETPSSVNPTKWILGKLVFQEFEDVWDNFERIALNFSYSIQNLDHRIQGLENKTSELGTKINSEEIASAVKFTEDFKKQIDESRNIRKK
jgi:hypothetical protein